MPLPSPEKHPGTADTTPWHECSSSNVGAIRQSGGGRDLDVYFYTSGTTYRYTGAGHLYSTMLNSASKGRFVHTHLKGRFDFSTL